MCMAYVKKVFNSQGLTLRPRSCGPFPGVQAMESHIQGCCQAGKAQLKPEPLEFSSREF